MISALKNQLISLLSETVTAREYFGELSNPQKPHINRHDVPLVLVDFTGDKYIGLSKSESFFNLYIIHVSYSKNKNNRTETDNEVLDLIHSIDKSINLKEFPHYEEIRLQRLQKIYDAVSEVGYLTVYMRTISVKNTGDCEL